MADKDILVNNDYNDRPDLAVQTSVIQNGNPSSVGPISDSSPWIHSYESSIISGSPEEIEKPETRSDPKRWYILAVFSLVSMTQGGIWNSYSPVSDSVDAAFGWGSNIIALINCLAIGAYLLFTPLFSWIMDVKGLRPAVLITMAMMAVGAGLRCITPTTPYITWLAISDGLLNGAAGPVGFGGIALVSAVWFPANQRVVATSISAALNGIGVAIPFLLAPALVPAPIRHNSTEDTSQLFHQGANSTNVTNVEDIKHGFMIYMYIVFGWTAALFLLCIVYFPSKPKYAPSVSAATERESFLQGMKQLIRSSKFWCLGGTYAVSNGVFQAWIAVMDINLHPLGVSDAEAGLIGFVSQCTGMIASVGVGIFSTIFARRMKLFLISLYSVGLAMFIVFALLCYKIIPFSIEVIYITVIIGSICLSGAVPLFFELTCEAAYPIAEGVTNGFVTGLNNIAALLFLLGLMVPASPLWMSWCLVGSTAVCLPFFFIMPEHYGRLDVDLQAKNQ